MKAIVLYEKENEKHQIAAFNLEISLKLVPEALALMSSRHLLFESLSFS